MIILHKVQFKRLWYGINSKRPTVNGASIEGTRNRENMANEVVGGIPVSWHKDTITLVSGIIHDPKN